MDAVDLTRSVRQDGEAQPSRMPAGSLVGEENPRADGDNRKSLRDVSRALLTHPCFIAVVAAAVTHTLWAFLVAHKGGDLAAQDAWAEFARAHPDSAYNLAWYGGVHPISYSVISPYVMAVLGVRPTMILAGTIAAGLLALLIVRTRAIDRPLWPALFGVFALTGNAVSGRVTFGLGLMFGLAAVAVIFAWPGRERADEARLGWLRASIVGLLATLATASSPVAGLFLGLVAVALWLDGRRRAAYAIGLPPIVIVAVSTLLFPFSGQQPMAVTHMILPIICGSCVYLLAPRRWRTVRIASAVYVAGIVLVWLIPSPIGSNMIRLGLIFGGVVLVAIAVEAAPIRRTQRQHRLNDSRLWTVLVLAILTSSIWQVSAAAWDTIVTRPSEAWTTEVDSLIHELNERDANLGRVEVVPTRSHREASALAPYFNLARGWNRQADTERNPIFYEDELLTPDSYRAWLDEWAVRFVVLPAEDLDDAADKEAEFVAAGLDYLDEVWANADWRLYEVRSPTPVADPPAVVRHFDADGLVLRVSRAGSVMVRIPYTPWMSLVDNEGKALEAPASAAPGLPPLNIDGCLSRHILPIQAEEPEPTWTVLHAPEPGIYRIAAPYKLPRGTACPEDMVE